jgi:phage tail sheath gpL-like
MDGTMADMMVRALAAAAEAAAVAVDAAADANTEAMYASLSLPGAVTAEGMAELAVWRWTLRIV